MRLFCIMLTVGFALFLGVMAYGIAKDVTKTIETKVDNFNQIIERIE